MGGRLFDMSLLLFSSVFHFHACVVGVVSMLGLFYQVPPAKDGVCAFSPPGALCLLNGSFSGCLYKSGVCGGCFYMYCFVYFQILARGVMLLVDSGCSGW